MTFKARHICRPLHPACPVINIDIARQESIFVQKINFRPIGPKNVFLYKVYKLISIGKIWTSIYEIFFSKNRNHKIF